MKLQKLLHKNEILGAEDKIIVTHVVNEIELGGEFTVCGRAIVDSVIEVEGWQAKGEEFQGTIDECDCSSCLMVIQYFKELN